VQVESKQESKDSHRQNKKVASIPIQKDMVEEEGNIKVEVEEEVITKMMTQENKTINLQKNQQKNQLRLQTVIRNQRRS